MLNLRAFLSLLSVAALALCPLCGCRQTADLSPSAMEEKLSPTVITVPAEPLTDEEIAAAVCASMTTEEKVGQLFFVRCPEKNAAKDVAAYHLGGVILFGRDFKDKTYGEVRAATGAMQNAADLPLLIAADEEGGSVVRASANAHLRRSKFAAPQTIYAQGGVEALRADAAEKSAFLLGLGVNVNLAPVCDVSTSKKDYIHNRTLGLGPEETGAACAAIVEEMGKAGIGSTLKHFPGYGNNADTHTGVAVDERSMETFETADLVPFRAAIAAGADSVLVSHNIVKCMDETHPASLSPAVHTLLRRDLGFEGVIMTDDLAMDALKAYSAEGGVAVLALLAGNDLVLTTDYTAQIPEVLAAVEDGRISQEQLDEKVCRVLRWKVRLGLLDVSDVPAGAAADGGADPSAPDDAQEESRPDASGSETDTETETDTDTDTETDADAENDAGSATPAGGLPDMAS